MPILYKYRSLANYKNFVDIILNNRLYAAKYKDMNDPMEGQYLYPRGQLSHSIRDKIYVQKNEMRICSLSRNPNNELMWAHYADGHKGVAIGCRILDSEGEVRPVMYDGIIELDNNNYNDQSSIEILSRKLNLWQYEEEERVFVRNKYFVDIQVTEVIAGARMSHPDYSFLSNLISRINSQIRVRRRTL